MALTERQEFTTILCAGSSISRIRQLLFVIQKLTRQLLCKYICHIKIDQISLFVQAAKNCHIKITRVHWTWACQLTGTSSLRVSGGFEKPFRSVQLCWYKKNFRSYLHKEGLPLSSLNFLWKDSAHFLAFSCARKGQSRDLKFLNEFSIPSMQK